jgi:hypothetical protein
MADIVGVTGHEKSAPECSGKIQSMTQATVRIGMMTKARAFVTVSTRFVAVARGSHRRCSSTQGRRSLPCRDLTKLMCFPILCVR